MIPVEFENNWFRESISLNQLLISLVMRLMFKAANHQLYTVNR